MSAWARSGRKDAANRAVALLDEMKGLWKAGNGDVGPSRDAYNAALNALSKSGTEKSARRDEYLLKRMEELFRSGNNRYVDLRPDMISYTSVMNDWAGCWSRATPRRANQILRHMRDLQDSRNAAEGPDTVAYKTALKAWILCVEEGGVIRVEELLYVMEAQCEGGDEIPKTDAYSHKTLLTMHAKNCRMESAQRAQQYIDALKNKYSYGDLTMNPDI